MKEKYVMENKQLLLQPTAVCVADHARAGLWLLYSCAYTASGPEGRYYGRSNRRYDLYNELNGLFLTHG